MHGSRAEPCFNGTLGVSLPLQVLQDMGLPTGAEGRDSSKGEDSAEETEAKPAVVAPAPVVEAVSTPSAAFPSDATAEVSTWWVLGVTARQSRQPCVLSVRWLLVLDNLPQKADLSGQKPTQEAGCCPTSCVGEGLVDVVSAS